MKLKRRHHAVDHRNLFFFAFAGVTIGVKRISEAANAAGLMATMANREAP